MQNRVQCVVKWENHGVMGFTKPLLEYWNALKQFDTRQARFCNIKKVRTRIGLAKVPASD